MIRPTSVEPREGFRIRLRYSDGTAGEVDLSHLAGRGVFELWNDPERFGTVRIAPDGGIAWGGDVELCPDVLYVQLTGRSVEEVMPDVRLVGANARSLPVLRHRDTDVSTTWSDSTATAEHRSVSRPSDVAETG